ncbi:MAG TPA: sugar ABC transporter permease [Candidatus Scybalocola faecipullorum]|nr:sugar ABC transporter permease [Candidatus Scybalocola faecipullorum]
MKTGRRKRLNKLQRDNIIGYGLIAPSMILLIAIGIVPILITVSYSFQYRVLTDPLNTHFVGLENYVTLFTSSDFGQIFWNTAVFAVLSLIIQLIVGFAGALLMNSAKRFVGVIRTAVLIPWAIPGIIIAYMFSFMFNDQLGVINSIIQTFGGEPVSFLTNSGWAMFVVVIADTWKQFPYISLMLLAGLQTIPADLYESASVDGATKVQQFFRITLPNLKGILLIVLLFRTMGAIRIFDIIFGITGGGPANSTATLLYQAYKYLFGDMNYGLGSALSTVITIIILIISIIYIKVLKTDD